MSKVSAILAIILEYLIVALCVLEYLSPIMWILAVVNAGLILIPLFVRGIDKKSESVLITLLAFFFCGGPLIGVARYYQLGSLKGMAIWLIVEADMLIAALAIFIVREKNRKEIRERATTRKREKEMMDLWNDNDIDMIYDNEKKKYFYSVDVGAKATRKCSLRLVEGEYFDTAVFMCEAIVTGTSEKRMNEIADKYNEEAKYMEQNSDSHSKYQYGVSQTGDNRYAMQVAHVFEIPDVDGDEEVLCEYEEFNAKLSAIIENCKLYPNMVFKHTS